MFVATPPYSPTRLRHTTDGVADLRKQLALLIWNASSSGRKAGGLSKSCSGYDVRAWPRAGQQRIGHMNICTRLNVRPP